MGDERQVNVEQEACQFVAGALNVVIKKVGMDDDITTLAEWTSIAHFSLVLSLEARINQTLSPDQIAGLVSVRGVADLLRDNG